MDCEIYLEALALMSRDNLFSWTPWLPWQIYIWGCLGLVAHWYTFIRVHPGLDRISFFGSLGWILSFGCGPLILWENREIFTDGTGHGGSRG